MNGYEKHTMGERKPRMFHHSAAQAQLIQISPTRVIHFSYLMMYLELPQNVGLITGKKTKVAHPRKSYVVTST